MARSPAPHAVQGKENGMGMRGSNQLEFKLADQVASGGSIIDAQGSGVHWMVPLTRSRMKGVDSKENRWHASA